MSAALLIHQSNEKQLPIRRGSIKGRAPTLERNREAGHVQKDYFYRTNPVFPAHLFWQRYRMRRLLYRHLMEGVAQYDDYYLFQWPKNDLVEHMWTHIGNQ